MATYTTLEEVKKHLNVDFTDDDTYIASLQDLVEELVAIDIGQPLSELEVEDEIPKGLVHAMKIIIGHFYLVREPVSIGVNVVKIPFSYEYLIAPYKNYTIV
ncbi:MAG TPA: head-tail connector protein [Bacteroidales bacterium]|nr:head-tail connector protein [Bacteroidales bacterium]